MKKSIGLLLCVGALPLITGCGGGNKLVCTTDEMDGIVSYEYTLNYSGDELKSAEVVWTFDFSKVEDFDSIGCSSAEECVSKAKGQKDSCAAESTFTDCKIDKETKDKVVLSAKVNDDQLDDGMGEITRKTSKEDAKKVLEEEGFKCK